MNTMKKFKFIIALAIIALSVDSFAQARYQGEVNLAYSTGLDVFKTNSINVETIHGARFNPYFFIGAGIGINNYTKGEGVLVPVFVDVKGYMPSWGTLVPFLSADLGYSFGTGGFEDSGGLYMSPTVGVEIIIMERMAFSFGIAYQSQRLSWEGISLPINSFAFKVGLRF